MIMVNSGLKGLRANTLPDQTQAVDSRQGNACTPDMLHISRSQLYTRDLANIYIYSSLWYSIPSPEVA